MKKKGLLLTALVLMGIIAAGTIAAQPWDMRGTWFRSGRLSGRNFDVTLEVNDENLVFNFSDRPEEVFHIDWAQPIDNNAAAIEGRNRAVSKAKEFPSGWFISCVGEGIPDEAFVFFLNAAKNKFTQNNDDPRDIWIKQ